jgi:hypothetical protein
MAILPVGGEIDGIARALERRAQLPAKVRFVFDDENAHVCLSPGTIRPHEPVQS